MTTKRILIALAVLLYLMVALYFWWNRQPIGAIMLLPIECLVAISPIVVISVLVYKFMERRKAN